MKKLPKNLVYWLIETRILSFPRKMIKKIIVNYLTINNKVVLTYDDPERAKVFKLIKNIKNEIIMLLADNEAYQIFMAVDRTKKLMVILLR